jgi:hypothetical protein
MKSLRPVLKAFIDNWRERCFPSGFKVDEAFTGGSEANERSINTNGRKSL